MNKESTLQLQLKGPDMDTFKIYQEANNTYRVHLSKVVSPWPDDYSFLDIIKAESKERSQGKVVSRDAWETSETICDSFSDVIQTLSQAGYTLTQLNPTTIKESIREPLIGSVDFSDENGPHKSVWLEKLME